MADIASIRNALVATVKIYPEKSRLEFGGQEVAFHCDKFNTRIVKGLEDMMGFKDASALLVAESEKAHYDLLDNFFVKGAGKEIFSGLTPEEKLCACFEVYKVFAYGAFDCTQLTAAGGTVTSKTSYLAVGWLENMERWRWTKRENPVCHDACGQIAAAAALSFGKSVGSYKVTETKCLSMGQDICEFKVEVK